MNHDYTVAELADMLTEQILGEQFLSKEKISPKVEAFIKAFVNLKNVPKNYNAYESKSAQARRLRAIEQKGYEIKFWREIVKELAPNDIDKYYKQHQAMLVSKGFKEV